MHEDEVFGIQKNDIEPHTCISANMRSEWNVDKDTAWILQSSVWIPFMPWEIQWEKSGGIVCVGASG